jgi:hypothetical protein
LNAALKNIQLKDTVDACIEMQSFMTWSLSAAGRSRQ